MAFKLVCKYCKRNNVEFSPSLRSWNEEGNPEYVSLNLRCIDCNWDFYLDIKIQNIYDKEGRI